MNSRLALSALVACLLGLAACDKTSTPPQTPVVDAPAAATATAGSASDPSVPSAASVFPAASAIKAETPTVRSNSAMSAAQESTAMPMPGQNNDHSAPAGPAKRASAP